MLPGIPLPPRPCITRWCTWLNAAFYYCDHFNEVKSVVDSLNSDDAEAIRVSQELFSSGCLVSDLAYIKLNFSSLTGAIVKFETRGLELKESIRIVEEIRASVSSLENKDYSLKLDAILRRNKGYEPLKEINQILRFGIDAKDPYVKKLSPTELTIFSYCPVSSADVERSFSAYGSILTEKRKKFSFENLKHHLIIYSNSKNDENLN